jgi:two-component system response regulator PilR (NtrC family)
MDPAPVFRKVLVIEDEPSMRNVLYVLLAGLGCDGVAAYSGQQALAMISHESYDAVLLDLRCFNLPAEDVVTHIKNIRPSLLGRVLIITGEVSDPKTLELIERHCLPHVSRERLTQECWDRMKAVLGVSRSAKPTC